MHNHGRNAPRTKCLVGYLLRPHQSKAVAGRIEEVTEGRRAGHRHRVALALATSGFDLCQRRADVLDPDIAQHVRLRRVALEDAADAIAGVESKVLWHRFDAAPAE